MAARRIARRSARAFKIPRDEKRQRFRERLFRDNVPEDRDNARPEEAGRAGAACGVRRETAGRAPVRRRTVRHARAREPRVRSGPGRIAAARGKRRPPQGPRPEWTSQAARGKVARRRARACMDAESAAGRRRGAAPMEPEAVRRRREAPVESEPAARAGGEQTSVESESARRSGRRAAPRGRRSRPAGQGGGSDRPWKPKRPPDRAAAIADRKPSGPAGRGTGGERGWKPNRPAGTGKRRWRSRLEAGTSAWKPGRRRQSGARKARSGLRDRADLVDAAAGRPPRRRTEGWRRRIRRDDRPRRPAQAEARSSPTTERQAVIADLRLAASAIPVGQQAARREAHPSRAARLRAAHGARTSSTPCSSSSTTSRDCWPTSRIRSTRRSACTSCSRRRPRSRTTTR